jgi:molybdopterin-synthase adenylyltransferase
MSQRYSRNESLFGADGQAKIAATSVLIVGLGGLGSHVAQQLAYLGVGTYALVDDDIVTDSSLNRLVGAVDADIAAATLKIEVAKRTIRAVQPDAAVTVHRGRAADPPVAPLIERADLVIGCMDRDLPRLQLLESCCRTATPLWDLATDTADDTSGIRYGGRVIFCDGSRCLVCLDQLDQAEIARDRMSPEQHEHHDRIYGIPTDILDRTGPMVVSVNGVVSSLAVTEIMAAITGLRPPLGHLIYRGEAGAVRRQIDAPASDCYYCDLWRRSASTDPTEH